MSDYDWKNIVKSKSNDELHAFIKNRYYLDIEARYYALLEMKSRNIETENFKFELYNDCISKMERLSKTSRREYMIKINPYFVLPIFIYSFINLLFNASTFTFDSIWLILTLFFGIGTFFSFIISKWEIRKINRTKTKEREKIERIIMDLKN